MSSTNFTSGTVISSSWLNDVNSTVYNNVFPNSGGGTTNFLRADGTWAAPSSGASATLQQVIQNGNTSTNNASIGGVGIGNQLNTPTGVTVYGITSTANYIGIQNNLGGSNPYTILLGGNAFIPYSNAITGGSTNSGIALGQSGYQWSSIGVAGSLYWNNTTITAPDTGSGGDATKFLNQKGSWVVPSGTGTGLTSVGISVPTGLSVASSPLTSNGTMAITWSSGQVPVANLGTGTANSSYFLRGDGAWTNTIPNNVSFGGVGVGNQLNAPTGLTVYGITSTGNYVGLQSNLGGSTPYTVLLAGNAFIPYPTNTISLGTSSYLWSSLAVAGSFYWGNATIAAPNTSSGSSTLFLNQQGSWVTPSGTGSGLTSVGLSMPTGFSVSGSPLTANGTLSVSWSGYVPTANLGSGTASSSTYLRGDGTWSTVTAATPTLQAVATAGSTFSGSSGITTTYNSFFGGVGIGVASTGPSGTAYGINTGTSTIGIGNVSAQIYLYGTSFIPSSDATLSLGSDSYRWQNIKVSGGASYFGAQSTFSVAPTVYASQSTSGGITLAAYQGYTGATASICIAAVVNSTSSNLMFFGYGSPSAPTTVGIISSNGTGVNYGSSSDRRLKSNIETYTASGAFIDALLPRTFTWTSTNTSAVGFVADELQTVCPDAVHGAANGVDESGNPIYQAVDASTPQMIANIVAELQSLRARLKAANIQ